MQVTLDLDGALVERARALAEREGRTLAEVVEAALLRGLNGSASAADDGAATIYDERGVRKGFVFGSIGTILGQLDEIEIADAKREGRPPKFG